MGLSFVIFATVVGASYFGVSIFRRVSLKRELLDIPNERSSHTKPMPHGAGVIIAAICLGAYFPVSIYFTGSFSWGYVAGAILITIVSFLDDLRPIPISIRLVAHGIAATLLIVDVGTWHGISMLGKLQLGNFAYVLTFLWIVWMVNAYNFMDGIDGLAGLQAVIGGIGWLILAQMLGMPALAVFSAIIAAASLGFLLHNWDPAKIFMGDAGSGFLGFTFAALPLLARGMATRTWDLLPIAAVLFVWLFHFDSLTTLIRRAIRGERVWVAHREHLFQRLVRSGLSHRRVTILYGVLTAILIISVLISVEFREDIGLAMFPVVTLLTGALLIVCIRRGALS